MTKSLFVLALVACPFAALACTSPARPAAAPSAPARHTEAAADQPTAPRAAESAPIAAAEAPRAPVRAVEPPPEKRIADSTAELSPAAGATAPAQPAGEPRAPAQPAAENAVRAESVRSAAPAVLPAGSQQVALTEKVPPPPSAFELALTAARETLAQTATAQAKLLVSGAYDEYLAALRAAAPQSGSDAAQALALGEALWPFVPKEGAASCERAHALAPNEAQTVYAHARAAHLRGDHAAAVTAYSQALELGFKPDLVFHALRTAALLRTGDLAEAVQVWQRSGILGQLGQLERDEARPGPSRSPRPDWYLTAERDLRAIHGLSSPERTRLALSAKIAAGDDTLFEDLIVNDCFWNGTHDFANSNRAYLKHDMGAALAKFGKESRRYIELEYFAGARMRIEPNAIHDIAEAEAAMPENSMSLPPSNIERGGKKLGFVGSKKNKHFPISSRLAPLIYRVLFMDGVTISVEWLDLFADELRERTQAGDVQIAVLMLDLYREAIDRKFPTWESMPEKREEFEQDSWARYKDVRIAQRLVSRRAKDIASDDAVLVEALKHFPMDLEIATVALEAARREQKPLREPLLRVAQAALAEGKLTAASLPLLQLPGAK